MLLFIDTSDPELIRLGLIDDKKITWHKFGAQSLSENLIFEIKNFFKKQKFPLKKLSKIAVVSGPGQFSKIRTGVAVANALAFGLKIPVLGVKLDKLPSDLLKLSTMKFQKMTAPEYDREPNITKPK